MRKIFNKSLVIALVAFMGISGFTACTDEHYTIDDGTYITGSEVITRDFTVYAKDWKWNDRYNRYEAIIDVKGNEITEDLYEFGTIVGTVFVNEKDANGDTYEVQKNLPFIQTYLDLDEPYSEIISFDIYYGNPSSVTFYIQATDGTTQSPYLMDYYFKVAFIKDSGN